MVSLTELKEHVDPLADVLIKGLLHLFICCYIPFVTFLCSLIFSSYDFAHFQKCLGTVPAYSPLENMGKEDWQKLADAGFLYFQW